MGSLSCKCIMLELILTCLGNDSVRGQSMKTVQIYMAAI